MAPTDRLTSAAYVRDLRDGGAVDQVLLVRDRELRLTRTGAEFMMLSLSDRTGSIQGLIWDGLERARAIVCAGEPLRIVGTFSESPRYGAQVTVRDLDRPGHVDWNRLVDGLAVPVSELEQSSTR